MTTPLRVLVAGCGNMGASHARAYHKMPEFEIVGLVSRGAGVPRGAQQGARRPAGVRRLLRGAGRHQARRRQHQHVSRDARAVREGGDRGAAATSSARSRWPRPSRRRRASSMRRARRRRKLVIGYILRVHPAWIRFIEIARTLGKPLVMRMNLNQQSHGPTWNVHRNLMNSMSPIVDCGVHYVDVMCQMTGAKPVRVSAIGARLTDELKPGMYNYGQLQVTFDDGSVGWYEAGWGPMMSEVAFFVKDVIGPKGCVSIVKDPNEAAARLGRHRQPHEDELHPAAPQRHRREQRVREARRVDQHRGRARSSGTLRSRAGVSPARHPAGRGSVGSHAATRSTACGSCSPPTRACGPARSSRCSWLTG